MEGVFDFLGNIPETSSNEIFQALAVNKNIKIERIISYGQTSPEGFWYDQKEDEFVLVLKGSAKIEYDDGRIFTLKESSSMYIPSGQKHRVIYTEDPTVWLALFIPNI